MATAPAAELLELQAFGRLLLVLRRDVVPTLAFGARQRDVVSHDDVSLTLAPSGDLHGADDRDRTGDLVLTKDVLCQLSYIGLRTALERETGIEPATNSLEGCDSTTELLPPTFGRFAPEDPPVPLAAPEQTSTGGETRIRTLEGTGPADLQSAAFDRSAISPILFADRVDRGKRVCDPDLGAGEGI
jgi:hypothetical protein